MADISKIQIESNTYDIKDVTARSDITTISTELAKKIESVAGAPERIVLYFDETNGDDTNDGRTPSTAMKTLNAGFEKYVNKGQLELLLTFFPGSYLLSYYAINAVALHFGIRANTTGNVTINFANPEHSGNDYFDIPFYNCHCHFSGKEDTSQKMILKATTDCHGIYFDGGSVAMDYTDLDGLELALHGSCLEATKVTIPQLRPNNSTVRIDGRSYIGNITGYVSRMSFTACTFQQITAYAGGSNTFNCYDCDLYFAGQTYVDLSETPSRANFLNMTGGNLVLQAGFQKIGSSTYTGSNTLKSVCILANQTRVNALKALATTNTIDSDCVYPSGVSV